MYPNISLENKQNHAFIYVEIDTIFLTNFKDLPKIQRFKDSKMLYMILDIQIVPSLRCILKNFWRYDLKVNSIMWWNVIGVFFSSNDICLNWNGFHSIEKEILFFSFSSIAT